MKGISIWQPWATLMAVGAKRIETRHWTTRYRGWVAIHAAKKSDADLRLLATDWPFAEYLTPYQAEHGPLPLGAVVAIGKLVEVASSDALRPTLEPTRGAWHGDEDHAGEFPVHEVAFGNYQPGRFGWVFEDVVQITPVPAKGQQGLWDVPGSLLAELQDAYRAARPPVTA